MGRNHIETTEAGAIEIAATGTEATEAEAIETEPRGVR